MDNQANGAIQSKVSIIHGLAAGIFYHEQGTEKNFEDLKAEELKPYMEKAQVCLEHIGKMGYGLILQKELVEKKADEVKHLVHLTEIIKKFVNKLNTTKPALFPAEELAHKILDGKI